MFTTLLLSIKIHGAPRAVGYFDRNGYEKLISTGTFRTVIFESDISKKNIRVTTMFFASSMAYTPVRGQVSPWIS